MISQPQHIAQFNPQQASFNFMPIPMAQQQPLVELDDDLYKIINEVEYLAFDQAGCRNIQKQLEDIKD